MIDMVEVLYNRVKQEMDTWDFFDAYSVSFFVYSNEFYEFDGISNVSEFNIFINNETYFKKLWELV